MTPFPLYHLCPEAFAALLPPLVEILKKVALPDAVFLLGASLQCRSSESIFSGSSPSARHLGDCTLLVLLADLKGKELHEWQDQIETHCISSLLPVTALVHSTSCFLTCLGEGHPFALRVVQSAPLIYNSGTFVLPPSESTGSPLQNKEAHKEHAAGLLKAGEFLAGAELFRLRRQPALAAFMLHQSAEQALRTLVIGSMGYSPNTHSLDRLLRYATLVSHSVPDLFPQRTEKDKRLHRLLQRAYIDSRYQDYTISDQDLALLTERVKTLHDLLSDFG